jgi:protein CpxP
MRIRGTRKFAGGLALAAVLALTGTAALAQQTGAGQGDAPRAEGQWGHKGGRMGRRGGGEDGGPFGQLNLTDAQKEQMRQIAERYRQTFQAQRGQRGERRGGGFDPLAGGAFDEAAVRAAAQARANAEVEREVARARMMYEMYNVLTAEQKAQLQTLRQQRRDEFKQRRQEFRTRRGAGQGTQFQ